MRQIAIVLSLVLALPALAQEGPKISSAIIALDRNQDLEAAKGFIAEAGEIISTKPKSEIKSKDLAKFYYYKGVINYRIHSGGQSLAELEPQALSKALEAFENLLAYEKKIDKERYSDEAREQMKQVVNDLARQAIGYSQKGAFKEAFNGFMKVYELKKQPYIDMLDTTMMYNAAVMAQNAKMYDTALALNQKLLEMGYHGTTYSATNVETGEKTVFPTPDMMNRMVESGKFEKPEASGDVQPQLYEAASSLALMEKDTALYNQLVEEGRKKYPKNANLLRAELQILFNKKQYDKALQNLDQAIAQNPESVVMRYNKGVILQTEMGRTEEALQAYQKALELDSGYTDALYMSSIIYIDSANAVGDRMNELPLDATSKYEKLKKKQKTIFEEALPYLEKAYEANPDDSQVITALRQVYRALKMYEKAKALPNP